MQRAAPYDRPWWRSPWFWALLVWFNLGPAYMVWVYGPIMEKSRREPPEYLVSPEVDAKLASNWIAVPLGALSAGPVFLVANPLSDLAHRVGERMGYPMGLEMIPAGQPNEPDVAVYRDSQPFHLPAVFLSSLIVGASAFFLIRRAYYELKFIRLEEERLPGKGIASEAQSGKDCPS